MKKAILVIALMFCFSLGAASITSQNDAVKSHEKSFVISCNFP